MAAHRSTRGGLSAQIVRITLLVGAVTITAAVVVSLVSVSRLSAQNMRSREQRDLQHLGDLIESRLRNVSILVDQASMHAFSGGETGPVQNIIELSFSASMSRVDQLLVADARGRVVASAPDEVASVRDEPSFRRARAGDDGFVMSSYGDGRWALWLTRTAIGRRGEPLIIMARLDKDFIERAVAEAYTGPDEHALLVLDESGSVVVADQTIATDLSRVRWRRIGASSGTVSVPSKSGETLEGSFMDVGRREGLNWRIVLVHPLSARIAKTILTVGPPVLVLLLGGAVALLLAWTLSMRISRPLRELERAALAAASGAYVRPISDEGDGEIGQVAKAFNAVSLRLNALHDLSQLLASASRLDQVLDGILAAMGHLVGPGSAAIYLLEEGPRFVPVRTRGRELSNAEPVSAMDSGWLNSALATGDAVKFAGDAEELRRELPGFTGDRVEALAAPLIAGHDQLGVVVIARDAERPLSDGEREMLRTFSAQASVAVHTSRLFAEETVSRKTAEALRQVAEELVRPASLDSALSIVEGIVARLFGATRASIVLVDRAAVGLEPPSQPDVESRLLGVAYRALDSADKHTGVAVGRGADAVVDSLIDDWDCAWLLAVPIAMETNHGGVLMVGLADRSSEDARMVGEALADEIALALDNAYFFQRAVTRAANLETIFRISQAVGSSLQINVVLNRVLDVVQKILSADAVALLSYDDRARVLKATMGRGELPGTFMSLELRPGEDLPGQVFSRGEPVALRDLRAGMGGLSGMAAEVELRSMLAVPLLARGRSIGVLIVFSMLAGAFPDEDVSVLQTFAAQAALAIDTARLYSREHEVASVLQRSILPGELPAFPEIETGSVYAPAGGEAEIGGDYYDVFVRGESIWFAIGDVCGKGVYAATKTSMIKYVVRALVAAGYSPAQVMAEVNNMIAATGDASDIVTLWLGCYSPDTGNLTWANGGHPPGLLRRSDGTIERLDVTGALLGALDGAEYGGESTSIGKGDTVLLFTDGVTEARRGNIFFGEERVRQVMNDAVSAQELAAAVLEAIRRHVEGDLRDDVAVLVIKPRADFTQKGMRPNT